MIKSVRPYQDEPLTYGKFPDGFAWGLATSSYQIEGAWNEDGKKESIWDRFVRVEGKIKGGDTGDIACDSYHRWEEDVALVKEIGATHYRFSISWPRILPEGIGAVNQLGVDYYNHLIDALLEAGIQPMATLYHWDFPQCLEDKGGWLNDDVSEWFEEYAAACFAAFGDRVKLWITLNEPYIAALVGYEKGIFAPGIQDPGKSAYICGHNMLKAHAKAYRKYKQDFKGQEGKLGISFFTEAAFPASDSEDDVKATNRYMQFTLGWFAHPIFKDGNYPQIMIDQIGEKSKLQGFPQSRLPIFTREEREQLLGSSDFIGLNHYTSKVVSHAVGNHEVVSCAEDRDVKLDYDPTWPNSGSVWLRPVPPGMRMLLNWVKDEYGNLPVYITENGVSDTAGNLDDLHRIYYYKHFINNVLKAIKLDGCKVEGYYAWSLMDSFEWTVGYSEKFGVCAVDFADKNRRRTMKSSAHFLRRIFADNGFLKDGNPWYDVPDAKHYTGLR